MMGRKRLRKKKRMHVIECTVAPYVAKEMKPRLIRQHSEISE